MYLHYDVYSVLSTNATYTKYLEAPSDVTSTSCPSINATDRLACIMTVSLPRTLQDELYRHHQVHIPCAKIF